MSPFAYQTPSGLQALPQLVKRRATKALVPVWRVAGANGRWRMPTGSERVALEEAYGEPGLLCGVAP